MDSILANITVVELSQSPSAGLAAMVMADFGAEVVWFEYGADTVHSGDNYRVWHRGKTRIPVSLGADNESRAAQAAAIRRHILASADVFLTDLSLPTLQTLGLDWATLSQSRPDLVHAEVSAFGDDNPYSGLAANGAQGMPDESLVAAAIGRMMIFEGVAQRPGPVYPAVRVGTHGAAQATLAGVLAQLVARTKGRSGQRQQATILRALTAYDLVGLGASQLATSPLPEMDPMEMMPMLNFQPVQCADGRWLQLGNLLPHLQVNFLTAAGLTEILEDPRLAEQPLEDNVAEEFRARICAHMATRSLDEWMALFVADGGVAAHPYQSTQQAMSDPDIVANGHSDDRHGFRQLGVLGQFSATPGQVAAPPKPLALQDLVLPEKFASATDVSATNERVLPLQGITVVEAAAIIASPLGASMLADLGARVIKLEPMDGDPFRAMLFGLAAERCNTDKESIALDLKSAEGQQIAQDLIAGADIFIHNYRPGVPERLGLDYETLCKRNPRLVHLSATGYGTQGPGKVRPSTHPVPGAALGGVLYQFGQLPSESLDYPALREVSRRLFRANELNPDPNTSFVVASAAVMGLLAAASTGQGQVIGLDMFGANAYANFDDFSERDDGSARPEIDLDYCGTNEFERLYPCKEGWLFVSVPRQQDQQRLMAEIGGWENLASQSADYWQDRLLPKGLGCIRADGATTGLRIQEPPFAASDLVVGFDHPVHGRGVRHGAMSHWPDSARWLQGACQKGDSTERLLAELGKSPEDIQRLLSSKIVASE
jgi:crotonobetainyl-CoA:carnitine CoA-transferase CaiB-like acyl-CoA transferase